MAAARAASTARRLPLSEPASSRPDELGPSRPRLDVVDRSTLASRAVHRQANLLRFLGVMFVVGALAVTAAAHTLVASDQQRIDALQTQLSQNLALEQDQQIARAELESPQRVLAIAEHQLGMVAPSSVTYLAPVNPGPSVAQVGTDAARAARASRTTSALAAGSQAHNGTSARSRTVPPGATTGHRSSALSGTGATNGNG